MIIHSGFKKKSQYLFTPPDGDGTFKRGLIQEAVLRYLYV
jgi:hypothetical protein